MTIKITSGATWKFSVPITVDQQPVDISVDEVAMVLKRGTETDDQAPVRATADVATRGLDGIALFDISDEDMNIAPGAYWLAVRWARANGEVYYPVREQIVVEPRVFS